MLKGLTIRNYAIIEELDIDFQGGLNIITGQTGAGKSILLGALGLLGGSKADTSLLLDAQRNLIVEGVFDIRSYGLESFFEREDIDYSDTITVRRQINSTGKSRGYIEDQPVTLATLKELMGRLVDIHSQHQSLLIAQRDFQTRVLDSVAGQLAQVAQYRQQYDTLRAKERELTALKESLVSQRQREDLLNHYCSEIETLKIGNSEVQTLSQELELLQNAANIAEGVSAVHTLADDDESGFLSLIHRSMSQLAGVKKYYAPLEELYERLNSSYIELKDISGESFDIAQKMELNPARAEQIEARLDTINNLIHKHGLSSEEELQEFFEQINEELFALSQQQNNLEGLEKEIEAQKTLVEKLAQQISKHRTKAAGEVEKHTIDMLKTLGIKDARLEVRIEHLPCNSMGCDGVDFLFSANAQSSPQPIGNVASGGEISRVMLALKYLMSRTSSLPTIIFDEIDTGVSGQVADRMGEIMVKMGEFMQVINITHLPQVASKGENHFFVSKNDSGTRIDRLDKQQRVEKIAEMLSGANITQAALDQAQSLLKS